MNEYAEIVGYRELEKGTRLSVIIPEKNTWGISQKDLQEMEK
ncbi:hypothetical protein [Crassaminicella thermophila]|nr:hypothetical protein [Crassaminicella thermophila]